MICHCGHTVLEPPVPCGTQVQCSYPCARPDPPCGHPKAPHLCHEDPTPCPPCVYLTEKLCACGKTMVGNIRCSSEKVSCGKPCGRPLGCGFHRCEQLCHGGACSGCTTICGKPRKPWCVLDPSPFRREATYPAPQSSSPAPLHATLSRPVHMPRGRTVHYSYYGYLSLWAHSAVRPLWAQRHEPSRARGRSCTTLHQRVRDRETQCSSCRGAWYQSRLTQNQLTPSCVFG